MGDPARNHPYAATFRRLDESPGLTIAVTNGVLHRRPFDRASAAELAACALLAPNMRRQIAGKLTES